jgi:hypothetical protein
VTATIRWTPDRPALVALGEDQEDEGQQGGGDRQDCGVQQPAAVPAGAAAGEQRNADHQQGVGAQVERVGGRRERQHRAREGRVGEERHAAGDGHRLARGQHPPGTPPVGPVGHHACHDRGERGGVERHLDGGLGAATRRQQEKADGRGQDGEQESPPPGAVHACVSSRRART